MGLFGTRDITMKFFLISLFLVCSFTVSKNLTAQDMGSVPDDGGPVQNQREASFMSSMQPFDTNGDTTNNKKEPIPPQIKRKIVQQMEHEILLSTRYVDMFAKTEGKDLISLESSLVDLRGQCQASYDKILELDEGPVQERYLKYYELLFDTFIYEAETLLEAKWNEDNVLRTDIDQELKSLREKLLPAEEYLTNF